MTSIRRSAPFAAIVLLAAACAGGGAQHANTSNTGSAAPMTTASGSVGQTTSVCGKEVPAAFVPDGATPLCQAGQPATLIVHKEFEATHQYYAGVAKSKHLRMTGAHVEKPDGEFTIASGSSRWAIQLFTVTTGTAITIEPR